MPSVDTLQMPDWLASKGRQATHEDYTLMLLTESKLTDAVSRAVMGALSGQDLASLVAGRLSPGRLMRLFMSSKVNPSYHFCMQLFQERLTHRPNGLSATRRILLWG